MAGAAGLDPVNMGKMSLWQIAQFRRGWIDHNTIKTGEAGQQADGDAISDEEFFAMMADDSEAELVEMTEEEAERFMKNIK